jgi:hypothetical protein
VKTIDEPNDGRRRVKRPEPARESPLVRWVRTGEDDRRRRRVGLAAREERAAEDPWAEVDRHRRSGRGPEYWYG